MKPTTSAIFDGIGDLSPNSDPIVLLHGFPYDVRQINLVKKYPDPRKLRVIAELEEAR